MVAVKICGVRQPRVAAVCADMGISLIGVNFVPTSRRCVATGVARDITKALAGSATEGVGVFRDVSADDVRRTAERAGVSWVQLHGAESPELCATLRKDGFGVIKALSVGDDMTVPVEHYRECADVVLLDGPSAGSGTSWRWDAARFPACGNLALFLAGGLTPDNVGNAIRALAPDGVDVASGVESNGDIDPEKIRAFCTAVRTTLPTNAPDPERHPRLAST